MAVEPRAAAKCLLRTRRRCGVASGCDSTRRVRHAAGSGSFYAKCGYREVGRVTYRSVPLRYFELLRSAAIGLAVAVLVDSVRLSASSRRARARLLDESRARWDSRANACDGWTSSPSTTWRANDGTGESMDDRTWDDL
jgi:hypothetical protein